MDHSKKEYRLRLIENLTAVGATASLCEYLADVLQCEYDIMQITGKYLLEINDQLLKGQTIVELCPIIQRILKSVLTWKDKIDDLEKRKADIPQSLDVDKSKLDQIHTFKAICSLETAKTSLKEGENVEITDSSHPGFIKVRNSDGKEGYLPLFSCFVPSPDLDITNCTERLRINLMTCASDLIIKLQSSLNKNLVMAIEDLYGYLDSAILPESISTTRFKEKFQLNIEHIKEGRYQLKYLARSLRNLENEFIRSPTKDTGEVCHKISTIDKTILLFLSLREKLLTCRADMKNGYRPIRIAQLDAKIPNFNPDKVIRYYEVRLTAKETIIKEEHSYFIPKINKLSSALNNNGSCAMSKCNEPVKPRLAKRCNIQSVVDLRTGKDISIMEAVALGILDHRSSLYVNLKTGERTPMSIAISKGLIKIKREEMLTQGLVENASKIKIVPNDSIYKLQDDHHRPKALSHGIITLKTKVMKTGYEIITVLDRTTGLRVSASEAADLGIIKDGLYYDSKNGMSLPLNEAIIQGWLEVSECNKGGNSSGDRNQEEHEETFAVESVYDHSTDSYISFLEAVKRHLVDPSTSCIIDSLTNEKIFPKEAIERGIIKVSPIKPMSALLTYGEKPIAPSSAHRYLRIVPPSLKK